MANTLKEIGRRVTLYDIIEQSEETDKLLKDIKEVNKNKCPKPYAIFFVMPPGLCLG